MTNELVGRVQTIISSKPVAIFMKGTLDAPMCGFSHKVVEAMRSCGVSDNDIASFDILSDDRKTFEALRQVTQWPTSPQVFINGKFVGGCDIICELYERGELQQMVQPFVKQ